MNQQIHWHTDWGIHSHIIKSREFNLLTRTNLWQSFNAVVKCPHRSILKDSAFSGKIGHFSSIWSLTSYKVGGDIKLMYTDLTLGKASNVTGTTNQSWRLRIDKLLILEKKEQPFSQCLSTYTICFVSFMNVYLKIKSWKQDSYQFPSKRRFSQRVAECKFTLQVYNSNNRWEINCHKGPLFRLWR